MTYTIRFATPTDGDKMFALLPRLAAFELPENRKPEHTYAGDGKMLKKWMLGEHPEAFIHVAVDSSENILGWAYVTMQPEFMSYEPGCHLEVILVDEQAAGKGIGQKLLDISETEAKKRGAKSMTLHVWANNNVARKIYEKNGFEAELLRYCKFFNA